MKKITVEKYLQDWAVQFLKHRDIMTNLIEKVEREDNTEIIKYKNNSAKFIYGDASLKNLNLILQKIKEVKMEKPSYIIVAFNTKDAITNMIKNWKEISQLPQLQIYFLNPLSPIDKKWSLFPYTHERISDSASFETGIYSMAENVGYINDEQIKNVTHTV